jgi:signal transduction histidine kinase/ActR/RegA family two-component response regulator
MSFTVLPPVFMAGIAFYVGCFHLLLYFRQPSLRQNLNFGLTCLFVSLYDAFSAALYGVSSSEQGVRWQYLQGFAVAFAGVPFVWFISDYCSLKSKRMPYALSIVYILLSVGMLLFPLELTYTQEPLVKEVRLPFGMEAVYHEMAPGPLTILLFSTGLVSFTYACWAGVKLYRAGMRQRAVPLLGVVFLFYAGAFNDMAVSTGLYPFVYTSEYAYLGFIVLMAFALSAEARRAGNMEDTLRESEEKLKEAQRIGRMGHWEFDLGTQEITISEQAYELVELHPDAGPPDPEKGLTYFDPEDSEDLLKHVSRALKSGEGFERDYRIRLPSGRSVHHHSTFLPIRDGSGKVTKLMGTVQDITERKQAEEERIKLEDRLRQAQKMEAIGTLAGGIAHDFNNILAAMIGYAELATIDAPENAPIQAHLKQIVQAGTRGRDIVKQILAFSRQASQEAKPVDMKRVVDEALKFLRATLPTTIEIRRQIQFEPCTILGDATQMQQVLVNLGTNAAHAMQEKGGVLEVSLTGLHLEEKAFPDCPDLKPGSYVKLAVTDTGHGMTREVMACIFDPFFTTKERGRGTGMGLSVVHGIVQGHGGAVRVDSQPGEGSTFEVYFPRLEREAEPEPDSFSSMPTGRERILLVDDEKALTDLGERMLGQLGYEVTARTSSTEALELFRDKPDRFDLVITDMTMPGMTGVELSMEVLRIRPDIPVILCTGFSERITEEQAKQKGIRAFMMKPFAMREVAETVRRVLAQGNGRISEI